MTMQPTFTYMGTKKRIAGHVAQVIGCSRNGPLLDLFAGISSVGLSVAPARHVWCNDIQHFAHTVATAAFTARCGPMLDAGLICSILELAHFNELKLKRELGPWLLREDSVLYFNKFAAGKQLNHELVEFCSSTRNRKRRATHRLSPKSTPYCLFAITYAGGYVGVRQGVELDSLRFAFDELRRRGDISTEQHRWMLIGLCKALSNVANTTGHFAQYLDVKSNTFNRFLASRRRGVFQEWLAAISELAPAGTMVWREGNKTFRQDAVCLLGRLPKLKTRPAVIYADPPYTTDQYSRYYHLLETLLLYDYPEPTGKGQYRPGRFVSEFSLRTRVQDAFRSLIYRASKLGVDLIVNYPKNGLLEEPKESLLALLRTFFRHAEVAAEVPHQHSTLGASKGAEKAAVTELIFYAR
jgi:adenine-specific DNA-methyltransferase